MELRKLSDELQGQIDAAKWKNDHRTTRPTNQAMEVHLHNAYAALDHGFIRAIDYMGDESAIVDAARVSYGRGTKVSNADANLIKYLMRHRHSTPFEMCEIKFHVKLPIFIARQWIRHRTANVNEYSARYSILDREFYIPQPEHLAAQSTANRQGRGEVLDGQEAQEVLDFLRDDANRNYHHYNIMLNEDSPTWTRDEDKKGLARELARINLTLNTYTQWYWKVNVHNLLNFLSLRADSHAQYEIRVYADIMLRIIGDWLPNVHAAFKDYRLDGFTLSGKMLRVVQDRIRGDVINDPKYYGLSQREWDEMHAAVWPE